jgi:signal transduction histidine kinase/HAMP domain-containing protein/ActR/RegA family two-component response regulator
MSNSLRTKSMLVVLVTLLIALGANTTILTWGFASFQKKSYENKAVMLGDHLRQELGRALNIGLPLDTLEGVNESCREVVDTNKEVGYCMLVDQQNRVLFHNDPLLAGRSLKDPASLNAGKASSSLVQYRKEDGEKYYDVSVPVLDPEQHRVGTIRLGLKYDVVVGQLLTLMWRPVIVGIISFFLASGLVMYFVSRAIITPVVEMSASASLISQGDLSRRLEVKSRDEVGQLGNSFNRMAISLQEREGRIQQGYHDLEKANFELQQSYRQLEDTAGELEMKSMNLNEKVDELSFLHNATDRLRSSIELDDILATVAGDIEKLGYERVLVMLVNEASNTLDEKVGIGFEDDERELLSEPLETNSIISSAVNDGRVEYIAQASLDSRVPKPVCDALSLREFAIIPMVGKDRCVGALLVDNRKSLRPMRRDKLDILSTFASTAAMAVENAYLYRQLVGNLETIERANRELRMLDQTKTNFLSLASHELRTPLVSVMGYLNLMLSGDLGVITDEQREMLEIAIKGASRLRDIIGDLLMVAKIEGGRVPLKFRWISASDMVKCSIEEINPFLGQRHVGISVESLDSLPKIEADFDRLQQCVTNMLSNAVKFTPDGGRVTVSGRKVKLNKETGKTTPVTRDNSILSSDTYIELSIEDTGIGISKENLERVFEKFFEAGNVDAHSTGKVKFLGGGTGLGLSIVRGIVEAHNGRIWAESAGEDSERCPGSRFIMLLPIKQPALRGEAQPSQDSLAPAPQALPRSGSKPRLLLVEDDEDTVVFTKLILDKKFTVVVARDGFEGMKKAFLERPDAILLDVWMRGIDGFSVCKILKENQQTADIPVAMFTAAAQKHEMERGYKSGADDYITKPFTPSELMSRVEKLVNSATAGVS